MLCQNKERHCPNEMKRIAWILWLRREWESFRFVCAPSACVEFFFAYESYCFLSELKQAPIVRSFWNFSNDKKNRKNKTEVNAQSGCLSCEFEYCMRRNYLKWMKQIQVYSISFSTLSSLRFDLVLILVQAKTSSNISDLPYDIVFCRACDFECTNWQSNNASGKKYLIWAWSSLRAHQVITF